MQPSNNQSVVSTVSVLAVVQTATSASTNTNALGQVVSTVTYETPKPCFLNLIAPQGAIVSATFYDANVSLSFNTTATVASNSSLFAPGGVTGSRILWAGSIAASGPPVILGALYTNGLVASVGAGTAVVGFYQNSSPFK